MGIRLSEAEQLEAYREAGVTHLNVELRGDPTHTIESLRELIDDLR